MKQYSLIPLTLTLAICFQAVASAPIIRLNTTGQPPLNTPKQTGFMDEVAAEAFRRIGYQLKTTRLPAERGLKSSNQGHIDGEMSRIKGLNKNYTNLLRVPENIMEWHFVAFSYKPIDLSKGWNTLSGKSVSYINGWKILENNIPSYAEIIKTTNSTDLFTLLRRMRADYIIYERWGGIYLLRKMAIKNVKICKPALAVKKMFIYLHKDHKSLVPRLAKALSTMKKDGSYQKLVKKHLTPLE